MLSKKKSLFSIFILIALTSFLTCAPGDSRWREEINPGHKAGFWAGLWHGLIILITFIVSLFTKEVGLYEVNNTGWAYNLGFLLGAASSLGGGVIRITKKRWRGWERLKKEEWSEIIKKLSEGIREGIKTWAEEKREKEWREIEKKIEEKVKEALKEWKEKEENQ